jgi:hypothetical protein
VDVPAAKATKHRPPIVEPKSVTHTFLRPGMGLLKIVYFSGALGMRFTSELDRAILDLKDKGMRSPYCRSKMQLDWKRHQQEMGAGGEDVNGDFRSKRIARAASRRRLQEAHHCGIAPMFRRRDASAFDLRDDRT